MTLPVLAQQHCKDGQCTQQWLLPGRSLRTGGFLQRNIHKDKHWNSSIPGGIFSHNEHVWKADEFAHCTALIFFLSPSSTFSVNTNPPKVPLATGNLPSGEHR